MESRCRPNGRILYVANSDERNIRAYDVDRDGDVSNERVAISKIDGIPDGIRTDEKGNLYVAAKGIAVYSPDGKLLSTIPVAETPSNCTFGDPDLPDPLHHRQNLGLPRPPGARYR